MSKTYKPRGGGAPNSVRPTLIEFILDETGSMQSCHQATVHGYNDFLDEQRNQTGSCLLTLTKFNSSEQKTPYTDIDVRMVLPMTDNMFVPGGGTNLYDTIGSRIRALEDRLSSWTETPNVLVVVMTDGEDNVSREYSERHIADLIKSHEGEGWLFVYLGATQNALDIAERLGFQRGNSKQFAVSEMRKTMTTLANATTVYRTTGNTKPFFADSETR